MMDKKCLEAEQIQLFIDDELSSEEIVRINEHLAQCKQCRSTVESARQFDEKLQKQFVSACSANHIARNVMKKVRELKAPDPVPQPSSNYFNLKWVPAFAIALIMLLAIFNVSDTTRFSSKVSISFVAADSSSTIDGVKAGTGYQFPLEPLQAVKPLSGKFLFERKLATDTTVFTVSGNVGVKLNSDHLMDFSGTHGDFIIGHISGNSQVQFTVNNGDIQTLLPEQKLEFPLATTTLPIEALPVKRVATEAVSIEPVVKIDVEAATAAAQVPGSYSAQVAGEKIPELIDVVTSEQSSPEPVGTESSDLVKDRPNPFVDAPLDIGGAQ